MTADRPPRLRSHELAIAQLRDWLTNRKIVNALISTRTAYREGLKTIYDRLEDMDEAALWATTAVFTRDRRVRRVIAAHAVKTLGVSKDAALRGLLEMSRAAE